MKFKDLHLGERFFIPKDEWEKNQFYVKSKPKENGANAIQLKTRVEWIVPDNQEVKPWKYGSV